MNLSDLAKPFPPERVSWRVGSTTQDKKRGMALAYIDARDVMDRLDEVCGPAGWSCRYPQTSGKAVICEIAIWINDRWVAKEDGAGDTDVEAEKGALSDAFKRAAVKWGIGRYLYDLDSPWVELEPAGRSYKIADREMKRLRDMLAGKGPAAPAPTPRPGPKIQLVDPGDGTVTEYARASEFLAALREKMQTEDPVFWWGVNGSTAKHLAEKIPQARAEVSALEQIAVGAAA